jgi:hypothetical protein
VVALLASSEPKVGISPFSSGAFSERIFDDVRGQQGVEQYW